MNNINFTFSDTIAGYVTGYDLTTSSFGLKTSDGRTFHVQLTPTTYAELVSNLEEPYKDPGKSLPDLLQTGRYLFAYGVFYPEGSGHKFEAKHIVLPGKTTEHFFTEEPDWWINQTRSIANFYLNAQFEGGAVDFRNYRTRLFLNGDKGGDVRTGNKVTRVRTVFGFATEHPLIDDQRQETDTISRTVYGLATAYMMTGDERFLQAAEKGTQYLQDTMCKRDRKGVAYWLHAVDVKDDGKVTREYLTSQFGDDYGAIPAYEQIYAIAGPTQTYRVTGNPDILRDIELTINLFNKCYLDTGQYGGFFSHLEPTTFDPKNEKLGQNRAKKNWNSVGDHAPAYLINLLLATGEQKYADFLAMTADTIVERFPARDGSPFVQERFNEDWTPDKTWGWQQDRAVCGHNLKIAWNLMRVFNLREDPSYRAVAEHIASTMPKFAMDNQRGGWYDVMERRLQNGEENYRFVWHDRKAWWQQEQAILAYMILHGTLGKPEYLRYARESAAFYNAWFLDNESGAVYFNTLANGLPYLLGNERLKGSHSMGAYHSVELAYLAATYTNLLITKQPLTLYFRPNPSGLKNRTLRVAPDLLPKGSIAIGEVLIDGTPYTDFNAEALTVNLPDSTTPVQVQVKIMPTGT
jgi:mannose/cellobiose epimerase-like protein (N-acyl-D-glucosamine 2-epimerase family)